MQIKVGIVGYGNLGKAVEEIVLKDKRFDLVKIFSRRDGIKSSFGTKFDKTDNLDCYKGKIDILFLCVGSYSDIEKIGIKAINNFNTVDSFDTHKKLKDYILALDSCAKKNSHVGLCAFGWDPGLMSLIRVLFDSLSFDKSLSNAFWGMGVSQGHSDALRRIFGVENAIQYTVPNIQIVKQCKKLFNYSPQEFLKHKRVCFVAEKQGENKDRIISEIVNMPNYFKGYDTQINFVSNSEIRKKQKNLFHKGRIINNFKILDKYNVRLDFSLKLKSNPHFTAQIMCVGALIVKNLFYQNKFGAYSILDVPLSFFSSLSRDDLLAQKL